MRQQDTADFIKEITVQQNTPVGMMDVEMSVFRASGGGLFAVDSSFLEHVLDGNVIQSPFDKGVDIQLNGMGEE